MLSDETESQPKISYSLEKKDNAFILECSADVGYLQDLRKKVEILLATLPGALGQDGKVALENTDPELALELPRGSNLSEDWLLYKIAMVGGFGSGKTCLLNRYVVGGEQDHFRLLCKATMDVDFSNKAVCINDNWFKLQLWDTSGNSTKINMLRFYLRETMGLVLTIDWSRTYGNSLKELESLFREVIVRRSDFLAYPIILAGTKSDDVAPREILREDIEAFAEKMGIPYLECSAKTGKNVTQVFEMLTKMVFSKRNPQYVFRIRLQSLCHDDAQLYDILRRNITFSLTPAAVPCDLELTRYRNAVDLVIHAPVNYIDVIFYLKGMQSENASIEKESRAALRKFQEEHPDYLLEAAKYLIRNLTNEDRYNKFDCFNCLDELSHFIDRAVLQQWIVRYYVRAIVVETDATVLLSLIAEEKSPRESIDKLLRILFFACATKGYWAAVQCMIEKFNVPFDEKNLQEKTALNIATENGHFALVRYLTKLQKEADAKANEKMTAPCSLKGSVRRY